MTWLAPTRLLWFALMLHAAFSEPSTFRFSIPTRPMRPGDTLVLKCQVMLKDVPGCTWLFQGPDPLVSPTFLVYVSRSKKAYGPGISNIKANRNDDMYDLTLTNFQEQHQGYYFCMVISSHLTHFSSAMPVFLTAPTTKPTTTLAARPSTRAPADSPPQLSARPEICRPEAGERKKKGLDVSCDTYIWAPLAGTCAFLLLWLITVLICSCRHRQRVCKCPRPQVRLGGKSAPSERSV